MFVKSRAMLFLFFIAKEQTDIATPCLVLPLKTTNKNNWILFYIQILLPIIIDVHFNVIQSPTKCVSWTLLCAHPESNIIKTKQKTTTWVQKHQES